MTTHRIATAGLLILSFAAAGTPAASAQPAGPGTPSAASTQSSTAIRPNPDEQTVTGATATREIAAGYSRQDKSTIPVDQPTQPTREPPILAAPKPSQTATLRQTQHQERLAYLADHKPNSARYSSAEMNAYASGLPTGVLTTVVHVASPNGGFDWSDAGIGAAGGIVLLMLGLGGMRVASRYRTRHSAALTG
jgi:hypothetical protein